ncbi:MAG TPA: hypothetical protein VG347_10900 [Verrucomicrobiae bacterium]|nr:hypothetical protein [Verrucomicrobiae bacterium]
MNDKISQILESRKKPEVPAEEEGKCFSIPAVGNTQELFLELRFKDGQRTCFDFTKLDWFNFNPESGFIDLDFSGFLISIKGRGLLPLFEAVKSRQVGWVKEADSDMQDNDKTSSYVGQIAITPPKNFSDEESAEPQ